MEVDVFQLQIRLNLLLTLRKIIHAIFIAPGLDKAEIGLGVRVFVSKLMLNVELKAFRAILCESKS